jgi:hypothetical protein
LVTSTSGRAIEKETTIPWIKGILLIQWNDEERFIYVPEFRDPLRFKTRDGREIRPERMYTDGGSIPRVFWSAKGFSPWGYGPAYVLHDWLFHQHRCGKDRPPSNYSMTEANQVLDDAIDLLMQAKKVASNQRARRLIKWAVDKFAKSAWNEPCDPAPVLPKSVDGAITVGRISFED